MKYSALQNVYRKFNLLMAAAALAIVFSSCTPKTAAVSGGDMASAEHLKMGKTIFENSCAKCHDLPNPSDHTADAWVGIMNSMAPKAKLNTRQHEMVYHYIVSEIK